MSTSPRPGDRARASALAQSPLRKMTALAIAALLAGAAPAAADPIAAPWGDFPAFLTPSQKLVAIDTLWAAPTSTNAGLGVTAARARTDVPAFDGRNVRAALLGDGPLTDSDHVEFADYKAQGKIRTLAGSNGPTSGHGQATASLMAGKTVGAAKAVQELVVGPWKAGDGSDASRPIARAVPITSPGDVFLLEYTATDPYDALAEYHNTEGTREFKMIRAASDLGRIVVEPAGNHAVDHDVTGTPQRDVEGKVRDSGAIVVGAGRSPIAGGCDDGRTARERVDYSGYGSRVDVQANACTPGAGTDADLIPEDKVSTEPGKHDAWLAARNGTVEHDKYATVAGTSGASAVIAGVVASLSSAYEGWGAQVPPTPEAVRAALVATGNAQTPGSDPKKIGPVPNLSAAYDYLVGAPTTNTPTGPATTTLARPTFTFSSSTTGAGFECRIVPDPLPSFETLMDDPLDRFAPCGSTWESTKSLKPGGYRVQARATKTSSTALGYDASPASLPFTVTAGVGTASVAPGGALTLPATTGARNVSIFVIGSNLRVKDTQGLNVGAGCTQYSPTEVDCPASAVTSITINGSALDDRIMVNNAVTVPVKVDADAGADTILSGSGADTLIGGPGDDGIAAGAGSDRIEPGSGDNAAIGSSGADTFVAAPGAADDISDTATDASVDRFDLSALGTAATVSSPAGGGLHASATGYSAETDGIDAITGTRFADEIALDDTGVSVVAGDGNDTVTGGSGADALSGGNGDDALVGGDGDDTLIGNAGNDVLTDGAGDDVLSGSGGDDRYRVSAGADDLVSDAGPATDDDVLDLTGLTGAATVSRGDDAAEDMTVAATGLSLRASRIDTIRGSAFGDTITTDDSGVTVLGGEGNDTITGGAGADRLTGGAGNDVLSGGSGNDELTAGPGTDALAGGSGSDRYRLSAGTATVSDLTPAADEDTLDLSQLTTAATVTKGAVANRMQLAASSLTATLDGIDAVIGSPQSDSITVDDSGLTVYGGAGDDTLYGGSGADWLFGEAGGDTITGGPGADWLYGGDGVDTLRSKDNVTDAVIDCGAGSNELSVRDFWIDSATNCERTQY